MSYDDVFGNLQDWGRVLDAIEQLRARGELDDHQQGLARAARYPFNWQLRQAGLRAIAELRCPNDEVILIAVQIMEDERNDMETRILAVHAVTSVLRDSKRTISERARSEAANSIRGLLSKPQPPVLHAFARAWEGALSEKTDTAANTH